MISRQIQKLQVIAPCSLLLFLLSGCQPALRMPAPEPVDYIDPFIGSVAKTKYYGRTFPGATRPFGMVSVDATGREKYTTGFRIDANR